ncbi:MAG: hypothetical protein HS104_05840 [Polyangiaceae bacterium]|nr:hypothetical protein [Polyangiaceae bacterium]MCE7890181.1 hypothetical protein [Sorangiineae bacterium PRO1]MCL4754558.1 hypothetical protein [Myxococcales bacterium]
MIHLEERELTIRIHLSASFDPDYDGDEDGYAWYERFQRELEPELVRALFGVLRSHPRFSALPAPRGGDPDSVREIAVSFVPSAR